MEKDGVKEFKKKTKEQMERAKTVKRKTKRLKKINK